VQASGWPSRRRTIRRNDPVRCSPRVCPHLQRSCSRKKYAQPIRPPYQEGARSQACGCAEFLWGHTQGWLILTTPGGSSRRMVSVRESNRMKTPSP
jgi:hypothetical protein